MRAGRQRSRGWATIDRMPTGLVATKLTVPRLPAGLVARPRLTRALDEGARGRLTVVSAPAGAGKTTLLSEWASGASIRVAWVSLDCSHSG